MELISAIARASFIFSVMAALVACTCVNDNWVQVGDRCYYMTGRMDRQAEAESACAYLGARLPILKSPADLENYRAFMRTRPGTTDQWVGFRQMEQNKVQYLSIDDGTPTFDGNWARGEPKGTEDCVQLLKDSLAFDDKMCDVPLPYACEQSVSNVTEVQCAPLQRYKVRYNSSSSHYMVSTATLDNVASYDGFDHYIPESLGFVYSATIQVPNQTQPLYQVKYGGNPIMATDADLPVLTLRPRTTIIRILAYVIPQYGNRVAIEHGVAAYLLWNHRDPTNSIVSTNRTEVSNLKANGWIHRATFSLFTVPSNTPVNNVTCTFVSAGASYVTLASRGLWIVIITWWSNPWR